MAEVAASTNTEQSRGRHGTCSTQLLTAKSAAVLTARAGRPEPSLVLSEPGHRVTLWMQNVTQRAGGT